MSRKEEAERSLNVPQGVSGAQRTAYLTLTDAQKRIYRRWFFMNGSPAAIALQYALEGVDL